MAVVWLTCDMLAKDLLASLPLMTPLPKAPRAMSVRAPLCSTTPQEFVFLRRANEVQAISCRVIKCNDDEF